ncbi:MAG: TolC family protein [Planctomycetota bacterium]
MKAIRPHTICLVVLSVIGVVCPGILFAEDAAASPPADSEGAVQSTETQEGAPASQPQKVVYLTLRQCVVLALASGEGVGNYSLQIGRIDPEIARAQVAEAEAAFDPTLSLSTLFADSRSLTASALVGADLEKTKVWKYEVGLLKKLKTGATVEFKYAGVRMNTNSAYAAINPYYDLDVGLTVTQPLLRGAWREYSTAGIRLAANSAERSEYDLTGIALQIARQVHEAYWNLVFAIENLEVRKKSLSLAEGVLEDNRKRAAVGSIAPLEVVGAEANVEKQKQEIIVAESAIAQARDELRNLINQPEDVLEEDVLLIPQDSARLAVEPVSAFDCVRDALAYRPELKQADIDIRSSGISIVVARNELLPVIDLVATYNRNGLGGTFRGASTDEWRNGGTRDWGAGVNVEVPLGNRAARSAYTRSALEKTKALLAYDNLRRIVILDVKSAVRAVETALASVHAAEYQRIFAEKNLIAEQRKFEVGKSTSLDVLQAQELLSRAESDELKSIVTYTTALVALEQTKGTLLKRLDVFVEPSAPPSNP